MSPCSLWSLLAWLLHTEPPLKVSLSERKPALDLASTASLSIVQWVCHGKAKCYTVLKGDTVKETADWKQITIKAKGRYVMLIWINTFPFIHGQFILALSTALLDKRRVHFQDGDYSAPQATGAYLCCFFCLVVGRREDEKRWSGREERRGEEKRLCIQRPESLYCVFIKHNDL